MEPDADPYASRRAAFRRLHAGGCFVLPNPWDTGSAKYLAGLGFEALASTSSGAAFARGKSDGAMTVDEVLGHLAELVAATELPVNADFEDGFAADLDGLARHVRRCVATGVAGLSIEDATGDPARPLYAFDEAVERVRAARAAIDATGADVMLVARAECCLVGAGDGGRSPFDEATARLVAYAEAGADCLYAPGVARIEDIAALVRAVQPLPLNVLLRPAPFPGLRELEDAGVRRVSVGGSLAVAAWDGFVRAARRLREGQGIVAYPDASHASLNKRFGA